MKRIIICFTLLCWSVLGYAQSFRSHQPLPISTGKSNHKIEYRKDKVFVRLKRADDALYFFNQSNRRTAIPDDKQELFNLIADLPVNKIENPFRFFNDKTSDVMELQLAKGADVATLVNRLNNSSDVLEVIQMPIYYSFKEQSSVDDPRLLDQDFLEIIRAFEAWEIFNPQAERDIVVAVIDDAIRITHEDLKDNIYINEAELNGEEGIDDDGNGYTDDINGWDPTGTLYGNGDPNPSPPEDLESKESFTHGTHTAGLVAATTDNGKGVASVSKGSVKILPIKATSDDADDTRSMTHTYEAILYAIDMEADIVSMSFGGYGSDYLTNEMITRATREKGMLFIAAAGNDDSSIPPYPAGYRSVMAVANTLSNDAKAPSSSFGGWVHVSAPGTDILSTKAATDSEYGFLTGTSMSCPIVAGMAGMLKAQNPDLTPNDLFNIIRSTASDLNQFNPDYQNQLGSGRIDVYEAMKAVVENKPRANFTWSPNTVALNRNLTFENTSFGQGLTYEWDFGDGTTSTEESPTHVYSRNTPLGVYVVTLKVTDENNQVATRQRFVSISDDVPSVLKRSVPYTLEQGGNFEGVAGEEDFIAEIVYGDENGVIWQKGVATGPRLESGESTVWKTLLNDWIPDAGVVAALYTPAFDLSATNKEFKLSFVKSMHHRYCNAPMAVQMEYSTDDGGSWIMLGTKNDIKGENWYERGPDDDCVIMDDIVSNQTGWSGTYEDELTTYNISFLAGNENVRFRWMVYILGPFGAFENESDKSDGFMVDDFQVEVSEPKANFKYTSMYAGRETEFTFMSGGAETILWEFGDGQTSSEEDPVHIYEEAGTYQLKLTVNGTTIKQETVTVLDSDIEVPFLLADGGDFESTNMFFVDNMNGSPLVLGSSSVTGKDGVVSGTKAYVLAPEEDNYTSDTKAMLYTPLFDLTKAKIVDNYFLEFKLKYDIDGTRKEFEDGYEVSDGLVVEYTEDNGKTWQILSNNLAVHWYNNQSWPFLEYNIAGQSDGFEQKYISISEFSGKKVGFRFVFESKNEDVTGVGFALDDFQIVSANKQSSVTGAALGIFTIDDNGFPVEQPGQFTIGMREIVILLVELSGDYLNYNWDFGSGALPSQKAKGAGFHIIYYEKPGLKDIQVNVNGTDNENGYTNILDRGRIQVGDYVSSLSEEDLELGKLVVFPNPVESDNLYLYLDAKYKGEVKLALYDLSGKAVYQSAYDKKQQVLSRNIPVSKYTEGMYFLKIQTDKGVLTQKVLIR